MIEFSDGMSFNVSGRLRILSTDDGWFVTGKGMLIPVSSREEAEVLVAQLEETRQEMKD